MVLLAQTQTFVLQLLHHTVEHIYNAVRLVLPYFAEPAAEILFAQQFHTAADNIHRFHNLTVEDKQEHQDKCNDSLYNVEVQRLHPLCQVEKHTT